MQSFDVVVVGGGPAGAISALKCSQLGFKTTLLEKGKQERHKTCGGVLPNICSDLFQNIQLNIPAEVMCSPSTIGLFYVPPSGKSKGGHLKGYRLLNVRRDKFDQWLRETAKTAGSEVLYDTELIDFKGNRKIEVLARVGEGIIKMSTRYLIGADGAYSTIRRHLYPDMVMNYLAILQEHWSAQGDFGEYFYAFFKGDVTNSYSYVIPKDGTLVIGTGLSPTHDMKASDCMARFKIWLGKEFQFEPVRLESREASAIPYGPVLCGRRNTILVGDAAGFCNRLSGEGIRLAIESAMAACEAIAETERIGDTLSSHYRTRVQLLAEFIQMTHEFAAGMTDNDREEFVRSELTRMSFNTFRI